MDRECESEFRSLAPHDCGNVTAQARLGGANRISLLLLVWVVAYLPVTAIAAMFTALGDLPGGNNYSETFGVSADGAVVVGWSSAVSSSNFTGRRGEAFRWDAASGMTGLGILPGLGKGSSFANAASSDGSVIVGDSSFQPGVLDITTTEAFRWDAENGMVGLGVLPGPRPKSAALGVSADGSVVVGQSQTGTSGSRTQAFRWDASTGLVALDFDSDMGLRSQARAVSIDGSVIGGNITDRIEINGSLFSNTQTVFWTDTGLVRLGGLLGNSGSSFFGNMSPDGTVVVGGSTNVIGGTNAVTEAYVWDEVNGMVGLGDLPGGAYYSFASDISADGSRIVGTSNTAHVGEYNEAFFWDRDNGMRTLRDVLVNDFGLGDELLGWELVGLPSISDDGMVIVGTGFNPDDEHEAFRAVLSTSVVTAMPEPSTIFLTGVALLCAIGIRRRRLS